MKPIQKIEEIFIKYASIFVSKIEGGAVKYPKRDEFKKELSTLVKKERESAVRGFFGAQYKHIVKRRNDDRTEIGWEYELSDQQKFLETYLNTTEEEE